MIKDGYEYRIRKLTPFECYRLMGVSDDDAKKMLAVNSNTQCYKQAGNSIVVDTLCSMYKKLFIDELQDDESENNELDNN